MASLKLLPIYLDTVESRKLNVTANPHQLSDHCPVFSFTRSCIVTTLNRVKHVINVSSSETDLSNLTEPKETDKGKNSDMGSEDLSGESLNEARKVKKSAYDVKKRSKIDVGLNFSFRRSDLELGRKFFLANDGELDVNYSVINADMSLEECNAILKRLEKCCDSKALIFFEWMKSNGKLKKNVTAYNLVLRVCGRREDWEAAEKMIREVRMNFGSELNFQVFNTLIYACSKRGCMEMGANWFRLMLEFDVLPNVATFGMLMGLYKKRWNVKEAEFAFTQMRKFGIVCESAYSAMITIYTRLNLFEKAEEIIRLIKEDEVVPNLENWLVVLNAYSQQGKLEEAEVTMASMREAGYSPNIVAYNTLITGYGKVSDMDAAQRLFLSIKDVGLESDETTYRSMIEGWGRAGNYREAKWFYMELKRLGYKPKSSNLYTLINLQAKYEDEEGAVKTLDDMLTIGCQHSSILGTLLQAYEKAGRIDKVPRILKGSLYQHVLHNLTSCSILVMAYVKHGLVDDAIKVLGDKKWKDPVFEDNLYHLLICSCKDSGHLDNAVKIYSQMPTNDGKLNLHILCTMIDTYSVIGMFTEAEKLYLKLKSSGIRLDMIAYTVVVRMYVKSGFLKDACIVLETMEKQKDIAPDVYLYRDMLRIYQRCGMLDKLSYIYYQILKTGINWDQELYNCVINCCARALPIDELSRIFDEMVQRGFTPNTITFNVMLDVYGKAKLFKKVRQLFSMAKKLGLVDIISYNTVIAAYGRNKNLECMSSSVQEMLFDGFSVSLEAYNSMLDAYGKEGQMENFRNVLRRMKEGGCASDHYTYNIMINIYGERGWIHEVASVLSELKDCALTPDLCSYNTLIKAYGIAGMVEDAVGLIKEMREKGVEPDKITYTNMITALRRNDKFLEAIKWSLWMKQMGYKID